MHAVCGQRRAGRIVSWPSGSGPLRQQSSVGLYLEFRAMGDQKFTGASYPYPHAYTSLQDSCVVLSVSLWRYDEFKDIDV